jgi:hypothetical protein
MEIQGSIEDRDCAVFYRAGGKVLAVASIFRDKESLRVEAEMERSLVM